MCAMDRGCRYSISADGLPTFREILAPGRRPKTGAVRRDNVSTENPRSKNARLDLVVGYVRFAATWTPPLSRGNLNIPRWIASRPVYPRPPHAATPPLTEFTPSRKRKIGPPLRAAAAQHQPTGFPRRSLLPAGITLMDAHVWRDRILNPFETWLRNAIQPFGWRIARACVHAPDRLIAKRARNRIDLRDFDLVSPPHRPTHHHHPPTLTARWKASFPLANLLVALIAR